MQVGANVSGLHIQTRTSVTSKMEEKLFFVAQRSPKWWLALIKRESKSSHVAIITVNSLTPCITFRQVSLDTVLPARQLSIIFVVINRWFALDEPDLFRFWRCNPWFFFYAMKLYILTRKQCTSIWKKNFIVCPKDLRGRLSLFLQLLMRESPLMSPLYLGQFMGIREASHRCSEVSFGG